MKDERCGKPVLSGGATLQRKQLPATKTNLKRPKMRVGNVQTDKMDVFYTSTVHFLDENDTSR